jgi:diacylglycerol kinase (ATP)
MVPSPNHNVRNQSARLRKSDKPCVILNANAGPRCDTEALIVQLKRLDPAVIRVTGKAGDAQRFAREAVRNHCDFIITAGGDGTLNEVVNGVAPSARPVCIGMVPLGTGNDFARGLNLPGAIEDNIDVLRSRKMRPIDIVRVRSRRRTRYFVNVSAGGFSDIVDEKLTPEIKQDWGPLAYWRSAAAALPQLHAYHAQIEFDREVMRLDVYNVIVANGRFVAGGLPIAPEADPGDGLLDLVLIPTHPLRKIAVAAAEMLLIKHLTSNAVVFRRGKRIAVRSQPPMWFNVDGEPVGAAPAVFEVVPRALNFIVRE